MKKVIALALAIALLLGCTVAFAESTESHPTPNISSFAKLKTKDNGSYITITMDKPVDKLFVNWAEQKAVPEELAVEEINGVYTATALRIGHKYMPGVTQKYVTNVNAKDENGVPFFFKNVTPAVADKVIASEQLPAELLANKLNFDEKAYVKSWVEVWKTTHPGYTEAQLKAATTGYENLATSIKTDYEAIIDGFILLNEGNDKVDTFEVDPAKVIVETDAKGNPVLDQFGFPTIRSYWSQSQKKWISCEVDGKIEAIQLGTPEIVTYVKNHKASTIWATKNDTAFITVQGDWIVEYNRGSTSGCQIVAIRYNDGEY